MTMDMKVRPWLLIVLAAVILIGGGFTWWYMKSGKTVSNPTTSPTPTKSAVISPSSSGSGKTATPSGGGSTATPTATPTPTTTPPTGWKETTNIAVSAGSANFEFSVYIKNDWQMHNQNDTAHGPVFYTNNTNCNVPYGPGYGYQNCWDGLAVAYTSFSNYSEASNMTIRTYPYPDGSGNGYVGVNKSLSASDQQIIFDSFKILSYRTNL